MLHAALDRRPIIVALAGPNGAGKTTFYDAFLRQTALRFVNADEIGGSLGLDAYEAARITEAVRGELVAQRESFIFETVLSDPVGDKVAFLRNAAASGYTVLMCFVGLPGPKICSERVAMRVSQGGHDVPEDKITARYPRTLANLRRAIRDVPFVLVFDNSDLASPYRLVAQFEGGEQVMRARAIPRWFAALVRQ